VPVVVYANHSDEATMKRSGARQEGESVSQLISKRMRPYRNMGEGWKQKVHDLVTIATEGEESDVDS